MLQNSFLQHLLLFHKGTKCQTLRYGRWRSPHKCATKSKLKNTLQFALYETSSISFLYLLFVGNSCFFLLNQRLVFHKTSACFSQNDVLFYWKRRVVFFRWWISHFSALQEDENNGKLNCENTYNNPLSRVRVRAHITGILSFLLSQVSQTPF